MRHLLLMILLFQSCLSFAQVPVVEIEGRIDVHLPADSTSTHVGFRAGEAQVPSELLQNTFVGSSSGRNNTTGQYNTFIGSGAGWSTTTGQANTFVGAASGSDVTEGSNNSFFGMFSGFGVFTEPNNGNSNSYFGFASGASTQNGSYNCYYGNGAGSFTRNGSQNVAMGSFAMHNARYIGSQNVAIGDSSMYDADNDGEIWSHKNVAIGASSLKGEIRKFPYESVAVGYEAGYDGGFQSIFIGHQAGKGASRRDKSLYVSNKAGEDPLVYGEFDNEVVQINGALIAGKNSTGHIIFDNTSVQAESNSGSTDLLINQGGGKVGIGNPNNFSDKLHVNSSAGQPALRIQVDGATRLRVRSNGSINLGANVSVAPQTVHVASDYKLGIGITDPQSEIDIEGLMHLRPRKIQNDECDHEDEVGRVMYDEISNKLQVCTDIDENTIGIQPGWISLH